jgi:single-stranded DNA-binding protein
MSINVVVREGNLTKDPTYFAGAGDKKSFASLRVASYGGKDKDGEKLTIYASVKCYGFLADQIKDLTKGDTVVFSGRVVADPYEQDGKTVESESVVADNLTYRKKGENASPEGSEKKATKKAPKPKAEGEEIPF